MKLTSALIAAIAGLVTVGVVGTAAGAAPLPQTPSGLSANSQFDSAKPFAEIVCEKSRETQDGVKGKFFNGTTEDLHIEFDHMNGGADKDATFVLPKGKYFTYTSASGGRVDFRSTTGEIQNRAFMLDPGMGYPKSETGYRASSSGDWAKTSEMNHHEREVNRIDRAPFDLSVKREPDGNRNIAGEGRATTDWANFDIYVDGFDAAYTKTVAEVANKSREDVEVQAYSRGHEVSPCVKLKPGESHRFEFTGKANTVEVYDPQASWPKPVQILAVDCPTRQSQCEITSKYRSWSEDGKGMLKSSLGMGAWSHMDAPEVGTFVRREAEDRDPNIRSKSMNVLLELHKVPTAQI